MTRVVAKRYISVFGTQWAAITSADLSRLGLEDRETIYARLDKLPPGRVVRFNTAKAAARYVEAANR